jgi:FkbM family methyltransferase
MHGWSPKHFQFHPFMLFGALSGTKSSHFWVARVDEEAYLHSQGYKNVKAIGLPVAYITSAELVRRPRSLLVMPTHSLDCTTLNSEFERYAEIIRSIQSHFVEVLVCVHPSCWRNGYWVSAFRKRGVRVIKGAFLEDRNALDRMSRLFSSFEYVTTNGLGSHIAYAAYFGAKVSIFGPYVEYSAQEFANDPFYRENPRLLEPAIRASSEEVVRQHYSELFCHPLEARQRIEWGQLQVGSANKVTAEEMRYLFGWTVFGRCAYNVRNGMSQPVKHWAKLLLRPEYRRIEKELECIRRIPRYTPSYTNLLGRQFEFQDSVSFLEQYQQIFEKQMYRFQASQDSPLIVDTTADVGLSVVYFKKLYAKSRIVAFEPDPDVYSALEKNCSAFGLQDVQLFPRAIWTRDTVLSINPERLSVRDDDGVIEVTAVRLKDFLHSKVDLLKLEIKGSETDVLIDCVQLLRNVENLFILYSSLAKEPQAIDIVMRILKDAGFRLYICGDHNSAWPFLWRHVGWGTDMTLQIFAFRP